MRVALLGLVLAVGFMACAPAGDASVADGSAADASVADASSNADAAVASNRFDIAALRVVVEHDRPDLALEKLAMSFHCLPRVGGVGGVALDKCGILSVDGASSDGLDVEFLATGRDSAETKPISFRFSTPEENVFCVGMKVWFQGVPNQIDSTLYVVPEDRYSILSYCTEATLPAQHADQPRWTNRRASTFEDFLTRLSRPIPLTLRPKQ